MSASSVLLFFNGCGVWILSGVTFPLTGKETLTWCTPLPILMQNRSGDARVTFSSFSSIGLGIVAVPTSTSSERTRAGKKVKLQFMMSKSKQRNFFYILFFKPTPAFRQIYLHQEEEEEENNNNNNNNNKNATILSLP